MPKAKSKPEATIGCCIYCRNTAGPLTEEHVLPANLGGIASLLEACCKACQKEINENIEQPCLRSMFRDVRYKLGIGSRRLSERPKELTAYKRKTAPSEVPSSPSLDPHNWERITVPYSDHPTILVLPIYGAPGIIRIAMTSKVPDCNPAGLWWWIDPVAIQNGFKRPMFVETNLNDAVFKRLLAKIAHGFTVCAFGLDGFEPFLNDIILGNDQSNIDDYIGGSIKLYPPDVAPYTIEVGILELPELMEHISVKVRIFSAIGAPTYYVISGRRL